MEKPGNYRLSTYLLFSLCLILTSACKDNCELTRSYYHYQPVYAEIEDIRNAVKIEEPRPIAELGKIYYKDKYLYLNEPNEGIHVIDNRDPVNPLPIAFINIPGNFSLAAKGNTLYANSYMDLLSFDISNPSGIVETDRLIDVFMNYSPAAAYFNSTTTDKIVVEMQYVEQVEISDSECDSFYNRDQFFWRGGWLMDARLAMFSASGGASSAESVGVGGSMATFTIYDDYLYAIDNADLLLADISINEKPSLHSRISVGWGIETLFPVGDKLFIGASDGMYIYDNELPSEPKFLSKYIHVNSCDPVVVQGDYAYVTLRSGTQCQGFSNQLEIIDISDLRSPRKVAEYPMFNPHGLGIDGSALFICDGDAGLKIFDATDINKVSDHLLKQYRNLNALDVIPLDNVLMLIGDNGLYQYDYSDLNNIQLLSSISIFADED